MNIEKKNILVKISKIITIPIALAGCDSKPKHYYVMCDEKDAKGWSLINAEKNEGGYIMACTYQSPDLQQVYTVRCRENGCE